MIAGSDQQTWLEATRPATEYLLRCQRASGAITESVRGSSGVVDVLFRLADGADVWHTVNALLALQAVGETPAAAAAFVRDQVREEGGLPYWSARPGLCIETTAAGALALLELRPTLVPALRRYALPEGRWATFILDEPGGFDHYLTAPSVTAWALAALSCDDPLVGVGRRYLLETRDARGLWAAHDACYATPFYPAHLAAAQVPDRDAILAFTLESASRSGGWGFGDPPREDASTLPTAWALLTLLACDPTLATVRPATTRAADWLLAAQRDDGSFPAAPLPPDIFYTGSVYATSVAIVALARLVEAA